MHCKFSSLREDTTTTTTTSMAQAQIGVKLGPNTTIFQLLVSSRVSDSIQRPSLIAMASIEALPEEIIDRIVAYIHKKSTLKALVNCSHRLTRITTPHLYSSIDLGQGSLPKYGQFWL